MMMSDFEQYQMHTLETATYPDAGFGTLKAITYVALGLGEAGEVQGKVSKIYRDDNMKITDDRTDEILDELGDVLWFAARLADELGVSLQQVADRNLKKLASRKARGVISGSGDRR
jgi:NTP pyrophosphatase (non-canonical NTP hydrolase)